MCSLESLTASGTISYPMQVTSNTFFVSLDYHQLAFSYFFSHIYLARVAKLMTKSFWPLCISLACNKEMTGNRKISRKD